MSELTGMIAITAAMLLPFAVLIGGPLAASWLVGKVYGEERVPHT